MAGLDDFFAKRDKGKKKKKDKFTPADLLEKQAEQVEAGESEAAGGGAPAQEPAWGAMVTEAATGEPAQQAAQEADDVVTPAPSSEEWRDFDEDAPDYSGLRVQNMQLSAPEANGDEEDEAEEEEGAEGAAPGPWKEVQAPVATPAPAAAPATEDVAIPNVAAGRYVPPSLRNRPAAGAVPSRTGKRNKAAPNIGSQDDFPTLGDRPPSEEAGALKAAGFERVSQQKGGARYAEEQSSRIELGNKFGALQAGTD